MDSMRVSTYKAQGSHCQILGFVTYWMDMCMRTLDIALLRVGLGALFFAPNRRFMVGYETGLACFWLKNA